MRHRILQLLLIVCLWVMAGCHHGGAVPPGWQAQPYQPQPDDNATLQVFICYGSILSNHTALRLVAPDRPTLMWDPGGTYKLDDSAYARKYDVLTRGEVSMEQWWQYRRDNCREPILEVFEWSLTAKQARRLHTILTTRHDPLNPSELFEPDAGGLGCCKRVSEFLDRFAGDHPAVSVRYFWPHKLGEHLWTQSPDRVVIFRRGEAPKAYQRGM